MGDAHRAVGLVDVLAAGARGAVGVDAQILVVDLDLDLVVDHRIDPDRGEAGVAPRVRVEGRDAHQPVHAALGLEPAIGVGAADPDRRRFDAGLLAARSPRATRPCSRAPRPSAHTCAAASRPSPAPRCRRRRRGLRDSSRCRRPRPRAGFRARAAPPRRAAFRALASASATIAVVALGLAELDQLDAPRRPRARSADSRRSPGRAGCARASALCAAAGSSHSFGFSACGVQLGEAPGCGHPSQRCLLSSASDFLMSSATAWISARMARSVRR